MNAFLASAIHSEASLQGFRTSIVAWIKGRIEQRRRLQRERLAVEHLRQLEPYLLNDAGVDRASLNLAFARIVSAHASLMFEEAPRCGT
jgi:uncharacterized protein YjiS (DUF1127 family)